MAPSSAFFLFPFSLLIPSRQPRVVLRVNRIHLARGVGERCTRPRGVGFGSFIACTTAASASAFASSFSALHGAGVDRAGVDQLLLEERQRRRSRSSSAARPLDDECPCSRLTIASSRNGLRSRRQYRIARSMAFQVATGSLPSTVSSRMP